MNNKTIGVIVLILIVLIVVFFAIDLTRESQEPVGNLNEENFIENEEEEIEDVPSTIFPGEWQWEKTVYEDSEIAPEDPSQFALRFTEGGSFSSSTDCNGLFGGYEVFSETQTLEFGPAGSTLMFCENSLENEYKADLEKASAYSFTDDGLTLMLETEDGVMEFSQVQ